MYSFQNLNGRKFRTSYCKNDASACHVQFFAIDEITGDAESIKPSEVDFSTFEVFKVRRQKISFMQQF